MNTTWLGLAHDCAVLGMYSFLYVLFLAFTPFGMCTFWHVIFFACALFCWLVGWGFIYQKLKESPTYPHLGKVVQIYDNRMI